MKVVISGYIGKKITGIGRNLICLLDNATSDIDYVIYTNEDMKNDLKFKNPHVTVKAYPISKNSSFKNLLWTTFIFPFVALKERANCVLIPNFTLLLLKFRPTIVIMHDLIEFNVPNKFSKNKMFYRTKIADPITARKADHILTVSQNSKKDIMKFLNIKENKITVIYNGVEQEKFRRMNKDATLRILRKKKWPEDFLLYAGTIDYPGKNAMGVIKAFEKLKKDQTYTGCLVLAGMPGTNFEIIKTYIENSTYKNNIILTGYVTDEELIALYSACSVFIFISLYEGFGIPPLEALSCGAKTIVSNTSSLPEVVGKIGWTVSPTNEEEVKNTIVKALNYEVTTKYLSQIQQHLRKYDWKELSQQFVSILEKNIM